MFAGSSRWKDKFACRTSGLRRWLEIGRMRPNPEPGGEQAVICACDGALGKFANREAAEQGPEAVGVRVPESNVTPSKFRESREMLRYASCVTSATLAVISDLFRGISHPNAPLSNCGLHATPNRGWKLLRSDEHAGIMRLAITHPPGTFALKYPPLNAP